MIVSIVAVFVCCGSCTTWDGGARRIHLGMVESTFRIAWPSTPVAAESGGPGAGVVAGRAFRKGAKSAGRVDAAKRGLRLSGLIHPANCSPATVLAWRSEPCRTKGEQMRKLVQPPPRSRCDRCGGELQLKMVVPADAIVEAESEVLVCVACGNEQVYWVTVDPYATRTKAA